MPRPRWRAVVARGASAAAVCACAATATGAIQPSDPRPPRASEYQLKALFLVNFTRYVDWPPGIFLEPRSPAVVCIAGDRPAIDEVMVAGGPPGRGRRPVFARRVLGAEAVDDCHVLFIAESSEAWLGAMLDRVRTRPVLTVGETGQFARQGGIITLSLEAGRVRLRVDLRAARRAGLTVSSRLLQVAEQVTGRPD